MTSQVEQVCACGRVEDATCPAGAPVHLGNGPCQNPTGNDVHHPFQPVRETPVEDDYDHFERLTEDVAHRDQDVAAALTILNDRLSIIEAEREPVPPSEDRYSMQKGYIVTPEGLRIEGYDLHGTFVGAPVPSSEEERAPEVERALQAAHERFTTPALDPRCEARFDGERCGALKDHLRHGKCRDDRGHEPEIGCHPYQPEPVDGWVRVPSDSIIGSWRSPDGVVWGCHEGIEQAIRAEAERKYLASLPTMAQLATTAEVEAQRLKAENVRLREIVALCEDALWADAATVARERALLAIRALSTGASEATPEDVR